MILSASQLTTLRTHPHSTKLWLSVYQPATLLACRVNDGTIVRSARTITYDSVTAGSYLNVDADMSLLVGTSAGASDIGRIRVRSITSSVITVAENSISWADNLYLTIIQQVDIEAIFPRIIHDPADAENVIFYKDYDVAYTNQNTVLGSFVNMGSHRAAFLENGTAQLYYSATGTYNVNNDAMTYLWDFEGGTPTGSVALTPGYVSYGSAGHKRTKLTVSNASGGSDVSYRYISIYDRPENGTSVPILKWQLNQFSGSRSEGGYTLGITVRENIDQIQPNALVIIFADDSYGATDTSLGGQQGNEKVVFVGYVLGDTISYDYRKSSVEFSVGSVTEVMKIAEGFSISCESRAAPATWFEIADMSVAKAIYHYLRWQSTVLKTTDFRYTGDDRKVQYFDADRSSLFDAIDNFLRTGVLGELVSDRQGRLWGEILPEGRLNPLDPPVSMSLLKQDWIDNPKITEKRSDSMSFVEMGGIAYSGVVTGIFSALLTNAPDTAPLYRGKIEKIQGFILTNQDQLNALSGNYLASKNSRFPEIDLNLAGNYRNLDIAPIELVKPFIAPEDTVRNVRIQNEHYRPDGMTWSYDPLRGSFLPTVTLKHVTTGTAGATVEIPDLPDDSGFSVPNFQLPKIPTLSFPSTVASATGSSCCDTLAALGLGYGVFETLLIKNSYTPTPPGYLGAGATFGFEYSSNANMYNATTERIPLLNTGLVLYEWTMTGDWEVTSVKAVPLNSKMVSMVIDLPGNSLIQVNVVEVGFPDPLSTHTYRASGGVGSVGSFSESGQIAYNFNYDYPNYLQGAVGSNALTPEFIVLFHNIRFTIKGTPP